MTRTLTDRKGADEAVNLTLATSRDWFAAALEGVLGAESYYLHRVETFDELLGNLRSQEQPPDALILDDHLERDETADAIRRLHAGPLSPDVPLLIYTSGLPDDGVYADLLKAGAWDVVQGPIRSESLLAALRRYLVISRRLRRERRGTETDDGADLPAIEALFDRVPVLEAMAKREGAHIVVMAVGPTGSRERDSSDRVHEQLAELCVDGLRRSDLCGWLDSNDDLAVVAYSRSQEGARVLAERLSEMAARRLERKRPEEALSVGVVELGPDELPEHVRGEKRADAQLEVLADARRALEEAREAGGGIRFATRAAEVQNG